MEVWEWVGQSSARSGSALPSVLVFVIVKNVAIWGVAKTELVQFPLRSTVQGKSYAVDDEPLSPSSEHKLPPSDL